MKKIALLFLILSFMLSLSSCGATNVEELLNLDILTQWPYQVKESREELEAKCKDLDEKSDEYRQVAEKIDMLDYLEKYSPNSKYDFLQLWDTVELPVASKYVTAVIPYATKSGNKNSLSITINDMTEEGIVNYIKQLLDMGYGNEEDFYHGKFKVLFHAVLYQGFENNKGIDVTKSIVQKYGVEVNGKKVLKYTDELYKTLKEEGFTPSETNNNRYLYISFDKQGNLSQKCLIIYTNTVIE